MAMDLPVRKVNGAAALFTLLIFGGSSLGVASTPAMDAAPMRQPTFVCANAGALRITCVGNFVDGSSAAGITVRVFDKRDRVVYVGTVDSQGRVTFRKPDAEFHIVFDAGQGDVLTMLGSEMT